MNHYYGDILDRVGDKPLWFDEHAVPRFCKFSPRVLANIYASECVLFLITCQGCNTPFKVAMSSSKAGRVMTAARTGRKVEEVATLAQLIERGDLDYGDPPNMRCCASGPTMNSVPRRVLEYWRDDALAAGKWTRDEKLERAIHVDWFGDDE